ncbi:hypothetical protein ACQWFZ_25030, partial [Salmonella enterica subsp. enterica serovar Infantis]
PPNPRARQCAHFTPMSYVSDKRYILCTNNVSHINYFSGVKNKKTASGSTPEAVKFTLLLSQ